MQRLELLSAKATRQDQVRDQTKSQDQAREDVLDVIGVKIPFESPFYLFFFVDDLIDQDTDWVSFIGYQMKSPGPAFWGRISKSEGKPILMKGSCIYRTNILNQMVKQWKANGFQYGAGSVKDRSKERIKYNMGDTKKGFDEMVELKTIASYNRGEINKLPSNIDPEKLNIFNQIDLDDLVNLHINIDREGTREKGNILFLTYKDYERYKAFLALEEGNITKEQFNILYPWEHTLDMMEQIIYKDLNIPMEDLHQFGMLKLDYPQEYKKYLSILKKSIENYEKGLNRIDPTALVDIIYEQILNFFQMLETGKIKISPKEQCPELSTCLKLDGSIDENIETCQVYLYPSNLEKLE